MGGQDNELADEYDLGDLLRGRNGNVCMKVLGKEETRVGVSGAVTRLATSGRVNVLSPP